MNGWDYNGGEGITSGDGSGAWRVEPAGQSEPDYVIHPDLEGLSAIEIFMRSLPHGHGNGPLTDEPDDGTWQQ